ncbi:hypothetical protein F5X68DRAFT_44549 [Plectosphaerella plurivora]|uniref:Uncharacterized protein n=1 Tax=Plectosphaerella plurivora TaxID=936078 RepID=A0A9P9A4S6_9PEZI|nr:hypothetical protein F5X68DRAFT_44549 [Plectosphaerella plurivora]
MDALKKAAEKVTGGSSANSQVNTQQAGGQPAAGGQDYGDKAFAAGIKKSGYNISPQNQEKVTDAGRGAFEKATGKNVPDKFSN